MGGYARVERWAPRTFGLASALIVLLSLVVASGARAAFPGVNGRILFDRQTCNQFTTDQIFSVNPDGSGPANLSNDPTARDGFASYSADGKLIAFNRLDSSSVSAQWLMNADGSGKHQLTTPPAGASDQSSAFSPDGQKVVFERTSAGGDPEHLFVVNISGSNEHQLMMPPAGFNDETPTWSPDGSKIAFMREPTDDSGGQIMLVNADGTGTATAVSHPPAGYKDTDPNFSPDGTKLVFTRSQATELGVPSNVFVVNVSGTGETNLTNETVATTESEDPAFSPDGTMIVYGRLFNDATPNAYKQLNTMRADGSGKQPITPAVTLQCDNSPSWQPLAPQTPPVPALSGLNASPKKVSIAGRKVKGKCVKPTKKNKGHKPCRRAIKLTISYSLSVNATVTMTLKGKAPGRKVKGKCVTPTKKNKKKPKCTRQLNVPGTITRNSTTGTNSFKFNGKIGGKKLKPGTYELTATATANGKTSTPQKVTFKIAG